jgi:transcriptional regulator with XRE-family HTH domain
MQKNCSLSFFEVNGFSKSSLSDFENGKRMVSVEKLDLMLQ